MSWLVIYDIYDVCQVLSELAKLAYIILMLTLPFSLSVLSTNPTKRLFFCVKYFCHDLNPQYLFEMGSNDCFILFPIEMGKHDAFDF